MTICKVEGCNDAVKVFANGSESKYCPEHAEIARTKYFEMIAENKRIQSELYAEFEHLYNSALELATIAGVTKKSKAIEGIAYVEITPARSKFANWLCDKRNIAQRIQGRAVLPVEMFDGDMQKKYAFAEKFSNVLRSEGINATPVARLVS